MAITNVSWPRAIQQTETRAKPTESMLEAFTTLGHLAAMTTRVRLGATVASATWRPPALTVTTLASGSTSR
jgi:alkanesulfonate monooxygenase SsuD/methylene tetrahydromethanopterin reductase-like flavin-dependent oxidoreductase (luciferase family)